MEHQCSDNCESIVRKLCLAAVVCCLVLLGNNSAIGSASSSQFSYQGRLLISGTPANGIYDLQFALFDDPTVGNQVGPVVTNSQVTISNGLFFTALDLGTTVFNGTPY